MACLRFLVAWPGASEGVPAKAFLCSFKVTAIAVYRTERSLQLTEQWEVKKTETKYLPRKFYFQNDSELVSAPAVPLQHVKSFFYAKSFEDISNEKLKNPAHITDVETISNRSNRLRNRYSSTSLFIFFRLICSRFAIALFVFLTQGHKMFLNPRR